MISRLQQLSSEIILASERKDEEAQIELYSQLTLLCLEYEGGQFEHPVLWEALGDFSEESESALVAYGKGLVIAEKLDLIDYYASIKFAIAECHLENNDQFKAKNSAQEAMAFANQSNNLQLKIAIDQFIAELEK